MEPLLLEETLRRKLDRLALVATRIRAGSMKGERRSKNRGTSIEFADYRNYTPGDDLRRLDWNVYARLERLYLKLFEDEEDLAVHVLLDASASMNWPQDEDQAGAQKITYARRLFAALAYIGLSDNDRVMLSTLHDRGGEAFGPSRGRGQVLPMLRYAHDIRASGVTDLNAMLRDYAMRQPRPGLCFVISDFFSPTGYVEGLNALLAKGHEVIVLHVLSRDEVEPPLAGDLRLIDVETGQAQEVSIDATMRQMYVERVEAWQHDIRAECSRRGVKYLPLITDMPLEKVILYEMRRMGIVK